MNITYKERQELNTLSQTVFGTSSKWRKLVDEGFNEVHEHTKEVMVPKANGSVVKKTFKENKLVLKRYTVEEIKKLMTQMLKERSELLLKQAQAEVAAEEAALAVVPPPQSTE